MCAKPNYSDEEVEAKIEQIRADTGRLPTIAGLRAALPDGLGNSRACRALQRVRGRMSCTTSPALPVGADLYSEINKLVAHFLGDAVKLYPALPATVALMLVEICTQFRQIADRASAERAAWQEVLAAARRNELAAERRATAAEARLANNEAETEERVRREVEAELKAEVADQAQGVITTALSTWTGAARPS